MSDSSTHNSPAAKQMRTDNSNSNDAKFMELLKQMNNQIEKLTKDNTNNNNSASSSSFGSGRPQRPHEIRQKALDEEFQRFPIDEQKKLDWLRRQIKEDTNSTLHNIMPNLLGHRKFPKN